MPPLTRTFPRGRRCEKCQAHLSIYNGYRICWPCSPDLSGHIVDRTDLGGQRYTYRRASNARL